MSTPPLYLTRKQQRELIQSFAEAKIVGELSDEDLVNDVVGEILNGMDTGSREEALLNELVDRFSAARGVE